jgi:serine/threonine protein phosphatase PrpC
LSVPGPRLASASVAGRRRYQQDAILAEVLPDGRVLLAVADGMGGHAAGEVASALALDTLLAGVREGSPLEVAFVRANTRVRDEARRPDKRGMGTTLVAVLVDAGRFEVANVGDSRAYLVSPEGIRQLTHDHSFAAEATERGRPAAEIRASRWRDALTRCVGMDAEVEVDVFGPFTVQTRTALVLCSDGLYKALTDLEVRTVFVRSRGPDEAARELASAAFESGSEDNISVVVAEFGEVPRERWWGSASA